MRLTLEEIMEILGIDQKTFEMIVTVNGVDVARVLTGLEAMALARKEERNVDGN